jgi:peroxiredoxin
MRKILYPVATLAIVALAFASFSIAGEGKDKDKKKPGDAQQAAASSSAKIGEPAPAFTLHDITGKSHSLADYAGKTVVLEWINPECPFVQRHYNLDTMTNLAAKNKDKDVVWLAIATGGTADAENLKSFAQKESIGYPILLDSEGTVGKAYNAKRTPEMFIIAKDGKLAYRGGIDSEASDQPSAPLKEGTVNYVDKALGELASGAAVSEAETKAYGCTVKYKQ